MKKVQKKKTVKLQDTFFPKQKNHVLNKRAQRVLNKPPAKKKKDAKKQVDDKRVLNKPPATKKKDAKKQVDDLLDSQCSIGTCFFDSQGSPITVCSVA